MFAPVENPTVKVFRGNNLELYVFLHGARTYAETGVFLIALVFP